jgi:hypothetical protein
MGQLHSWQESIWSGISSDSESGRDFAVGLAELYAQFIIRNGIWFMPDGSTKLHPSNYGKDYEDLLQNVLNVLLEKGLLD